MTGLQGPRLCAQVSLVSATLLVTLDRDNSIRLYPLLIPASLRRRLVIESSRTVQDHRLLAAESGSTLNTPAYLPLPPRLYIHTYVRTYASAWLPISRRAVYRGRCLLHSITSGEIGNRLQKLRVIADVEEDGRGWTDGGHVDNSFRYFDVAGVASFRTSVARVVYTHTLRMSSSLIMRC